MSVHKICVHGTQNSALALIDQGRQSDDIGSGVMNVFIVLAYFISFLLAEMKLKNTKQNFNQTSKPDIKHTSGETLSEG